MSRGELSLASFPSSKFSSNARTGKVVNLHVDPTGYWLYTNSPYDNAAGARRLSATDLNRVWKFLPRRQQYENEICSLADGSLRRLCFLGQAQTPSPKRLPPFRCPSRRDDGSRPSAFSATVMQYGERTCCA